MRRFRAVIGGTALALAVSVAGGTGMASAADVTVYKTSTCGCCVAWGRHLEANGFQVAVKELDDLTAVKQAHGITRELASCHTATVEGYVIEGHVPASDIHRLLKERPQVAGLAVPGMPMGSPGMEGPYKDRYDVVAFRRDGTRVVYASH